MDELIKELKEQGVLKSPLVEAAFRAIDRKDFVPPEAAGEAYINHPLSIGSSQTISQPYTVAFMLDLLDPHPGEKILDIGSGSGWQTALLAHIVGQDGGAQSSKLKAQSGGRVYAVERLPNLYSFATKNIERYNFIKKGIVEFFCRNATGGLPERAPFDKIVAAAASTRDIPREWREQLKEGGRIVAPVDDTVRLYVKTRSGRWREEIFPGFAFVPLIKDAPAKHEGDAGGRPGKKKLARILLTAYFACALAFLGGMYATFVPIAAPSPTRVEILPGAGSRVIGELLKEAGLVRSKWAFVIYTTFAGKASELQPGEYEFGGKATVPNLVRKISSGDRYANERLIVIPEGWNLRDIADYFERSGIMEAETWWAITGRPAEDYRRRETAENLAEKDFAFLSDKPENAGLEGFLFPDTYRVFRGATAENIARKMLENFDRKLTPELRQEISRQKKTVFAVVTMASLLEKEIPDEAERRVVAGILWKRLAIGMPLQVDATVNYATGKKGSPPSADLAVNSPYNTYRYPGLPVGPIANPGVRAIRAALFPEKSDYFYYLSQPDGKTVFSRTLAEHNLAKAKHLR